MTTQAKSMGRRHRIRSRRRWARRRRKERGRLIYALLEHLYGRDRARSMWSDHLRSQCG